MARESLNNMELPQDGPYNPDRVRTETETREVTEIIPPEKRLQVVETARVIHEADSFAVRFFGPSADRVRRVGLAALAGSVIGTAATNVATEFERGALNQNLTESNKVASALNTIDMKTLVNQTQEQVCKVIDADFMHRFLVTDENGNETLNPGGAIIPFAVEVKENCKAKIDVELHIPYEFARTFTEIVAKSPKARAELVQKLAEFIRSQAQNYLDIKGIAGVTDTAWVYNRATNELVAGKPVVDLGKFNISKLVLEGKASAESEIGPAGGPSSLQETNLQNIRLAGKRLNDMKPYILEAMGKNGVDKSVLENAKNIAYEHNLIGEEISKIADISRNILGGTIKGGDADLAYALIKEINNENPVVLSAINSNQEYANTINDLVTGQRGVNISFEASTEFNKTKVYNISVLLPLSLLLLPGIRIDRTPGRIHFVRDVEVVRVPDTVLTRREETTKPVARRLFSETTPEKINEERSFEETYKEVDLSENSRDTHALLQHMLIEEVLPSLREETREPLIDYEEVVNKYREYLMSNARKGGVKKGQYPIPEDAQRKVTEELIEMWERHDVATHPMRGIDVKTVINYRDSKNVVYWAKTLAYEFVSLMQNSVTTDEFKKLLEEKIAEAFLARSEQGNSNRNFFVKSDFPREDA